MKKGREQFVPTPDGQMRDLYFEEYFFGVYDRASKVMVDRQRKYGPHNIGRHGLAGIAVRLGDKLARLDRYAIEGHTEEMSDEAVEDTLIDIMNYAAIAIAWLDGAWTKHGTLPLREEATQQ